MVVVVTAAPVKERGCAIRVEHSVLVMRSCHQWVASLPLTRSLHCIILLPARPMDRRQPVQCLAPTRPAAHPLLDLATRNLFDRPRQRHVLVHTQTVQTRAMVTTATSPILPSHEPGQPNRQHGHRLVTRHCVTPVHHLGSSSSSSSTLPRSHTTASLVAPAMGVGVAGRRMASVAVKDRSTLDSKAKTTHLLDINSRCNVLRTFFYLSFF